MDSGEAVARFVRGYGLLELPLDRCVERLLVPAPDARGSLTLATATPAADALRARRADALSFLRHLTYPATRHVLFAVDDRWTAVVNNLRDGSDFADHHPWFGSVCDASSCRVVDDDGSTRRVGSYVARVRYPARVFELTDAHGATVRAVHCSLDGDRWTFGASGAPLPGEDDSWYRSRRTRDRFTSEHLQRLLQLVGVTRPVRSAFESGDRFVLLAEQLYDHQWRALVEAESCTPEQADDPGYGYLRRGLGWVGHMETHAPSVVWDMTRAVLLNPELEPEARPHLVAARRQVGRRQFETLQKDAEQHLGQHGG